MDEALRTRAARPAVNGRARASVLVGLPAAIAVPAGLALAAYSSQVTLEYASASIPIALVLGAVAVVLARSGRRHSQFTLGRIGGLGLARTGWLLGMLGLYLGMMSLLAVGVFGLLLLFS